MPDHAAAGAPTTEPASEPELSVRQWLFEGLPWLRDELYLATLRLNEANAEVYRIRSSIERAEAELRLSAEAGT